LKSFFEQRTIKQCKETIPPPLFLPTPLPPRSIAAVAPAHGNRGLPGKTLHSALLTLGDFDRQLLLAVLENIGETLFGSGTVRTGGLRAGWGGIVHGKVVLHGYSYVPGVTVTGTLSSKGSMFHIGGRAAARGTLRIGTHGTLSGVLGGHGVHLSGSSPGEAGIGFSVPRASTHLSGLAAEPKRLELLRAKGMATLLRFVFGA
jgi:hypothetical protein